MPVNRNRTPEEIRQLAEDHAKKVGGPAEMYANVGNAFYEFSKDFEDFLSDQIDKHGKDLHPYAMVMGIANITEEVLTEIEKEHPEAITHGIRATVVRMVGGLPIK